MPRPRLTTLTDDEWEDYEERAAILEFDAGLSRDEAEQRAMEMVLGRRRDAPKRKAAHR